jgi:hypothetical protein
MGATSVPENWTSQPSRNPAPMEKKVQGRISRRGMK